MAGGGSRSGLEELGLVFDGSITDYGRLISAIPLSSEEYRYIYYVIGALSMNDETPLGLVCMRFCGAGGVGSEITKQIGGARHVSVRCPSPNSNVGHLSAKKFRIWWQHVSLSELIVAVITHHGILITVFHSCF